MAITTQMVRGGAPVVRLLQEGGGVFICCYIRWEARLVHVKDALLCYFGLLLRPSEILQRIFMGFPAPRQFEPLQRFSKDKNPTAPTFHLLHIFAALKPIKQEAARAAERQRGYFKTWTMVPGVLFSHIGEQNEVLLIVLLSNQRANQLPKTPINLLFTDLTGILQEAQQLDGFLAT